MTVQWSTTVRNTMLDAWESSIGVSAEIALFTGAQPADTDAADSGTELVRFALGSDWAGAASGGAKSLSGTPIFATAGATGTAAHYRIYASDGTTCHEQGTVTATGGGGDVTIDNVSIASGQSVQITSWTKTAPGE
jgi:hypothetical protein